MAGGLLSDLGRRLYFPKGIVAQSAEAKKHAKRLNATIGIAYKGGSPAVPPVDPQDRCPTLAPEEIFPYAPTQGVEALRELWKKEIVRKNPDIGERARSRCRSSCRASRRASRLLADLFVEPGATRSCSPTCTGTTTP